MVWFSNKMRDKKQFRYTSNHKQPLLAWNGDSPLKIPVGWRWVLIFLLLSRNHTLRVCRTGGDGFSGTIGAKASNYGVGCVLVCCGALVGPWNHFPSHCCLDTHTYSNIYSHLCLTYGYICIIRSLSYLLIVHNLTFKCSGMTHICILCSHSQHIHIPIYICSQHRQTMTQTHASIYTVLTGSSEVQLGANSSL